MLFILRMDVTTQLYIVIILPCAVNLSLIHVERKGRKRTCNKTITGATRAEEFTRAAGQDMLMQM